MSALFYTERIPRSIRAAQVVGITASTLFAGLSLTQSFVLVPTVMVAPAPLLARQWQKAVSMLRGVVVPSVSLTSAAIFGYLAYREPPRSSSFKYYLASALLFPSVMPYTIVVLKPLTDKINERADSFAATALYDTEAEVGIKKEETVHALVDKWATLNLIRSAIVLAGSISAIWASLESVEIVGIGI